MENILKIATSNNKKATAKKAKPAAKVMSDRQKFRLKAQHAIAATAAAIATGMTFVSMNDIANVMVHYGHVSEWKGYALAMGIDLNYTAMEFAGVIAAYAHIRDRLHKWTRFAIPGVMVMSAMANVLEFTANASTLPEIVVGAVAGVFIPIMVFVTFRCAAILADV